MTAATRRMARIVAPGLVMLPLVVSTLLVFPSMDDGWLTLLVREEGVSAIAGALGARPLFGRLLVAAWNSGVDLRLLGTALNLAAWAATGWVAAALWKTLFPDKRSLAVLAACLAVAPIVVFTQTTTLTTLIPINLPVLLSYGAVLSLMRYLLGEGAPVRRVVFAALLIVAGLQISEYALAPALAGLPLLAWAARSTARPAGRRRLGIAAGTIILAITFGMLVFRWSADFSTRPDATLGSMGSQLLAAPLAAAFDALSALWRTIVAAPVSSLGTIRMSWGEKSTLAAAAWGGLTAILLLACVRNDPPGGNPDAGVRQPAWLLAGSLVCAVALALLPEFARRGLFYAGRTGSVELFSTRFYLAAVPLATCATLGLLQGIVAERARYGVPLLVGLVTGHAAFMHAFAEYRKEAVYRRMSSALEPFVRAQPTGLTVAVLSDHYDREYTVVYKTTRHWPADDGRRFWALWEGRMPTFLRREPGRSGTCAGTGTIDFNATGIRRSAPMAQLLWVDLRAGGRLTVEPYCVASR